MSRVPRLPGVQDPELLTAYAHARRLLRRPYVTGISVGLVNEEGAAQELGLRVHVEQKLEKSQLTKAQLLPKEIHGVRVVVIESRYSPHAMTDAERMARRYYVSNPARPGVQIYAPPAMPGTLGLKVHCNIPGEPQTLCLLTAAHVLPVDGAEVLQPMGPNARRIGSVLHRAPLAVCDAAVAVLNGRAMNNLPVGAERPITTIRDAKIGEVLCMSGAMTGMVRAVLHGVGEHTVTYADRTSALMPGYSFASLQDPTEALSTGGDSGALWFDEATGAGVGLHVAGDRFGGPDKPAWAFACPLSTVFAALDLTLAS